MKYNKTQYEQDSLNLLYFNSLKCLLLIICIALSEKVFTQTNTLNYKVIQGGSEIGWLKLQKTDSNATTNITFSSVAKKRMIIKFEITAQESATFSNGVMTQSSVFRKVNADIKVNKHTVQKGSYYLVNEKESTAIVKINGIAYNQLCMYFKEPENIKQVYSDNFQTLLDIENLGNHSYKVKFPSGDANYYYYSNGVCSKVKAVHSMFTAQFILSK